MKKSKILLKNTNDLLYNQHVKLYSRGKRSRKDEREVRVHASQKKRRKTQKHSFILSVALLLVAGYFAISFISSLWKSGRKNKKLTP